MTPHRLAPRRLRDRISLLITGLATLAILLGGVWFTSDGVRVEYADGFGLARPSNTTPVVVLRFEADSEAAIARIQADFRRAIEAAWPGIALPY